MRLSDSSTVDPVTGQVYKSKSICIIMIFYKPAPKRLTPFSGVEDVTGLAGHTPGSATNHRIDEPHNCQCLPGAILVYPLIDGQSMGMHDAESHRARIGNRE